MDVPLIFPLEVSRKSSRGLDDAYFQGGGGGVDADPGASLVAAFLIVVASVDDLKMRAFSILAKGWGRPCGGVERYRVCNEYVDIEFAASADACVCARGMFIAPADAIGTVATSSSTMLTTLAMVLCDSSTDLC